jgi:hypothetical protein
MLRLRARRLVLLLAALTALLLTGCAGVTTTSGPTGVGGQNRVWAFTPAAQLLAPQTTSQSSCLRPGFTASAIGTASGFCVAAEEAGAVVRGGETAATAYGRAIHASYDYGSGFRPEFRLANGQRADAVNLGTREVVELKPNNPAAIARGERQVAGYAQQLNQEFPGDPFTTRVVTYDRP